MVNSGGDWTRCRAATLQQKETGILPSRYDARMFDLLTAPASSLLLASFAAISLWALTKAPQWLDQGVLRPYWLVRRRQWGTVLSHAFLHADLMHLIFNGFSFWAFAPGLERALGTPRFLALYAVGLLASTLGTWLKQRRNPAYQCLGASGAVMAVVFAAIALFPQAKLFILPIPVPIPAPIFGLGYLAYSLWAGQQSRGHINHEAHLWGAVSGLLFTLLLAPGWVARAWLG